MVCVSWAARELWPLSAVSQGSAYLDREIKSLTVHSELKLWYQQLEIH